VSLREYLLNLIRQRISLRDAGSKEPVLTGPQLSLKETESLFRQTYSLD